MKRIRGWIIPGAVAALIAAAAYLAQPNSGSPEHSTNSDAANGASAALLFAQAMGHPTSQITGDFTTPASSSVMFVFSPTSPYTGEEAARILGWVRGQGGILIYASEQGDPQLDQAFGVIRFGDDGYVAGDYSADAGVLAGVASVTGGVSVKPLEPSPGQVAILRTAYGLVAGYVQRLGAGEVVVLADPLVLCNGYLEKTDNGRLLADLLGVDAGAAVAFDEYHHGLTIGAFAPQAWLATSWGAAIMWLLVAVFFGLLLRGRRFGPLVGRAPETVRSDVEWSVAVGQLLRRSSARRVTLGLLAGATERAVALHTGLPVQPRERFWNALWVRAPEVARELAEVENTLHTSSASEHDVLTAARRLHEIAHPAATRRK